MATTDSGDYGITAVSYNSQNTHIESLRVTKIQNGKGSPEQILSRETIVTLIESGVRVITLPSNENGFYIGAEVKVVEINYVKYLRTDSNRTAADNLGNLPRFQQN